MTKTFNNKKNNKNNNSSKNKKSDFGFYTLLKYFGIAFSSLMVSLFPLFLTNRYFNIRHDKLYLFYILGGLLVFSVIAVFVFFDNRTREEKLNSKVTLKDFSVTDFAITAFVLSAVISTVFSDYPLASLTGQAGRNNGLILIVLYALVYFIISRIYRENNIVPILACVVSATVSVIAILQQFYWDPLNLYAGLGGSQIGKFISTLGNRNILSAYLCITLPLSFMMFIYGKKLYELAIGGLTAIITFAGVICCNSDSSILGTGAFLIFCIIFFIRNLEKTSRLFFLIGAMIAGCKIVRIFSFIMEDYSMKFSKIQSFFVYGNTYIAIFIFFAIALALLFLNLKYPKYKNPKTVQYCALAAFALAFSVILALIIYYSVFDTKTKLTGIMTFLRFDDSWGTHRGFMWKRALYVFINVDIFQKIFGMGPDTFEKAMDIFGYNNELMRYKNETTNCAHNVYLNYLITLGLSGTISYITATLSVLIKAVRRAAQNKYAMIFAGSVLCYSVQSVVNIDQPITTPIFILMIAIVESQNRKVKFKNQKS